MEFRGFLAGFATLEQLFRMRRLALSYIPLIINIAGECYADFGIITAFFLAILLSFFLANNIQQIDCIHIFSEVLQIDSIKFLSL